MVVRNQPGGKFTDQGVMETMVLLVWGLRLGSSVHLYDAVSVVQDVEVDVSEEVVLELCTVPRVQNLLDLANEPPDGKIVVKHLPKTLNDLIIEHSEMCNKWVRFQMCRDAGHLDRARGFL